MKHNLLAIAYFRTIPGSARSIHSFFKGQRNSGSCVESALSSKSRQVRYWLTRPSAGELELRGWEATPRHRTRTWFEAWLELGTVKFLRVHDEIVDFWIAIASTDKSNTPCKTNCLHICCLREKLTVQQSSFSEFIHHQHTANGHKNRNVSQFISFLVFTINKELS